MRYYSLSSANAKAMLERRRQGEEPEWHEFAERRGTGPDYPAEAIRQLHDELSLLVKGYPRELRQRDVEGGKFEAVACAIVHERLRFDAQTMSDPEFWTWLAVVEFSDIVEWRHGGQDRVAADANYGIGAKTDNLLFRMWLRAELVYDKTAIDPYWLAKRGDQDLWRSHIIRQGYTNARTVARKLIEFQCPESGKTMLKTEGIRELAKRLRRLRVNVTFEYLNEGQIVDVITEQAIGL